MMKKLFILLALAVTAAAPAVAQSSDRPSHPFFISMQGGVSGSISENAFSYLDNGRFGGLLGAQGAFAIGYDFTSRIGARISVSYGDNASACNTYQTSAHGFYPYRFKSVNAFVDMLLDVGKEDSFFSPKLYVGLGGAHTFNFTDSGHPWQDVSGKNTVFGFRGGFVAQFDLSDHFGLFADLCGEAYTDMYNGLMPTKQDQAIESGYPGFPLDLRILASLGMVFHF